MIRAALAATIALGTSLSAVLADTVKVGFVTTLTTPAAVIGNDQKDAVDLAIEDMGGKMGDLDVEVIYEDDGFKPEIGKQKTDKLVDLDDVDFVAGYIWSNVLLASARSVLDAGKFLVSANAGPHQLAGEDCHENYFNISWQNDQTPQAMGEVLNQLNVKSLYLMGPNYAAGKDMLAGVESTFKGEILGKDLTKWPDQLDFSAELTKARVSGAEALFVFYPGRAGHAFVTQYQQAGLVDVLPLYTTYVMDSISLPVFQEAGMTDVLGSKLTLFWSPDLDAPQNRQFITNFKSKYGRYPSFYAAQAYDAMFYIKSAVEAVDGDLSDSDGLRAAFEAADFPSVRGEFEMGPNHYPIQNFYLLEVAEDDEGTWTTKIVQTVYEMNEDSHADKCQMN
ncbi:MAG TPA: ABC transporter substrate-binding protein [Aestuariivirgaceae bacterium]|nr:ABC transporter substrate-binding protein [Aestuariivirgaceae bacterium]